MAELNQVDAFFDIVDEACMLLYDELDLDYLDGLKRVANDILNEMDDSKLSFDAIKKLEKIYQRFDDLSFSNEAIREALNLLLIKGIKHTGRHSLDLITPDSISLLVANIIKNYFQDGVSMFEVNMGLGCQINTIANFIDIDTCLSGQVEDSELAELAKDVSALQANDLVVYQNKILDPIDLPFNCLIGYLPSLDVDGAFIPYEVISKYMRNLQEDGIFVVTIDNDFFSHDPKKFQERFTGTLLGLIVLPANLFKNGKERSILVGSKMQLDDYEMFVTNLPELNSGEKFVTSISKIENWIKGIRERVDEALDQE